MEIKGITGWGERRERDRWPEGLGRQLWGENERMRETGGEETGG